MKAKPEPGVDFRRALAAMDGIHIGAGGSRVRMRRWRHMMATPLRFAEQGGLGWRAFFVVASLIGGYPALLRQGCSSKVITVLHPSRGAGLDLRYVAIGRGPAWKITDFWASPTGHGRGRDVITAVVAAADATGTTLVLNAANRTLATRYYAPLGFVVRSGQEQSKRPWIERPPDSVSLLTARIDVA